MTSSLRVATVLYGAAITVDRLLALLLLPLLTRAIGAADYGAWAQTLAAVGLLMPLLLFGLPTAIVRSFSAEATAPARPRQFIRLGVIVVGMVGLCTIALTANDEIIALGVWGDRARRDLVPALAGVVVADVAVEFAIAWLRSAGRMGVIAGALLARSVLRYAVLWALVGRGSGIADWLGSYALAQGVLAAGVVAASAAMMRTTRTRTLNLETPTVRDLLAFSAPLAVLALVTALNASLDRFVLVQLLGLDTVAVYAAAASLSGIPAAFYSVLGFTLFPVLARHWAEARRDEAARLIGIALQAFLFLCLPACLVIGFTGPWLLPALTTDAYRAPAAVFLLLGTSVAAFGLYQILLYALLLAGRSGTVLALTAGAMALNLLLNLVLVPRLGAVGAAAAVAASNSLMAMLASRLAQQVMDWAFPFGRLWPIAWRALVAVAPLGLLMSLVTDDVAPPWINAALGTMLGISVYVGLDLARQGSLTRKLLAR